MLQSTPYGSGFISLAINIPSNRILSSSRIYPRLVGLQILQSDTGKVPITLWLKPICKTVEKVKFWPFLRSSLIIKSDAHKVINDGFMVLQPVDINLIFARVF